MATKNHGLDTRITDAAFSEFSKKGYTDASLRKIAEKTGVTIGAIRTRYKTKDELFCSPLVPFTREIASAFQQIRAEKYIDTVMKYHMGGWMAILRSGNKSEGAMHHEIQRFLFSAFFRADEKGAGRSIRCAICRRNHEKKQGTLP